MSPFGTTRYTVRPRWRPPSTSLIAFRLFGAPFTAAPRSSRTDSMPRRNEPEEALDLSAQLTFRIGSEEHERLQRLSGLISKSVVARLALELGMDQLEADPSLIHKRAKPPRLGRPPSGSKIKPV